MLTEKQKKDWRPANLSWQANCTLLAATDLSFEAGLKHLSQCDVSLNAVPNVATCVSLNPNLKFKT